MNKLNVFIVDDELNSIENLSHILNELYPKMEIIGSAQTLIEAEKKMKLLDPDIVFLDIQIGTKTVFELLEGLKDISFEIIFISAHNHAIKAFKYMAIDYLLKPIDITKLKQALERAAYNIENRNFKDHSNELLTALKSSNYEKHKIAVPTSDGYEFIYTCDILYCIADGAYTILHMVDDKKLVASQTLKFYEDLLLDLNFVRIHNSNLINTKYIKKVSRSDGGHLIMENGQLLSISRSRKEVLFKKLKLK